MFNWLIKRGQNLRFSSQISQTYSLVEQLTATDRAHALIWVGILVEQSKGDTLSVNTYFNNPSRFSRQEIINLYYPLEEVRIKLQQQLESQSKTPLWALMPAERRLHMLASLHAWQILLATLAPGLVGDVDDKVRNMWALLSNSQSHLDVAMERFLKCLRQMGAHDFPYSEQQCMEWAKRIPQQFSANKPF